MLLLEALERTTTRSPRRRWATKTRFGKFVSCRVTSKRCTENLACDYRYEQTKQLNLIRTRSRPRIICTQEKKPCQETRVCPQRETRKSDYRTQIPKSFRPPNSPSVSYGRHIRAVKHPHIHRARVTNPLAHLRKPSSNSSHTQRVYHDG